MSAKCLILDIWLFDKTALQFKKSFRKQHFFIKYF